jgi:two-component system NarL family sensor kinase
MRGLLFLFFMCLSAQGYARGIADSVMSSATGADTTRIRIFLKVAADIQNRDYANCMRLCQEVIRIAKPLRDTSSQAHAEFLQGLTSYFAGEYDQTLQHYLKAITLFEQCRQPANKARVLNELGIFYRRQKQDSLSLASFKEAEMLAAEAGDRGVKGTALNNQGIYAQDHGQHEEAIAYFLKAQNIYLDVGDSIGVSYTLDYASVSHAAMRRYVVATEMQTKALEIRLRLGDSNAAALSLINLAEFEKLQENHGATERYLKECLALAERIGYKDLTAYSCKMLAEVCMSTGRGAEAYTYQKRYSELNESIFNEKRSRQINDLQARYEAEKRIRQIEQLKNENERKEARNRQLLIGFTALLLLMSIGGYARYSQLKSRKQKELDDAVIREKELCNRAIIEAEEKERLRIARDLHDGVAQTMTAARMQLEHYLGHLQPEQKAEPSLRNAFDLIREAAGEVRAVSHSMVPNALLKSGLVAAVRDFVQRTGTDRFRINLVVHGISERLNENVETVVFRVLQELVSNIMKHARANEVTVQLLREGDELSIMVEDNGQGFDPEKLSPDAGMGLRNIRSRVEYLDGHVDFDSSPGRGTTVMIEIPLKDQVA